VDLAQRKLGSATWSRCSSDITAAPDAALTAGAKEEATTPGPCWGGGAVGWPRATVLARPHGRGGRRPASPVLGRPRPRRVTSSSPLPGSAQRPDLVVVFRDAAVLMLNYVHEIRPHGFKLEYIYFEISMHI